MGWVAARLRAGPIPALRSLWHGPFSAANERAAGAAVSVASVRRTQETRLGAGGGGFCRWVAWYILGYMRRVVMRYGVAWRVWDGISWDRPAVGAGLPRPRRVRPLPLRQARHRARRSRHGGGAAPLRRVRPLLSRQARLRAHRSRHGCGSAPLPHGASVSSGLPPQETRHVPPGTDHRRASRPHQPSEVWRAAALQVKSYRPAFPGRSIFAEGADRAHRSFRSPPSGRFAAFGGNSPQGWRFPPVPGGRGVCAPRRKHSLHVSPAAPKAQGKRAPPGGKDRQRRAFPTPAVRRGFSAAPIAVCRSSPRCPR